MRSIVTHYLLPNSPRRVEAPESLRKAVIDEVLFTDLHDMPWELRKLQMEVLEDLKYSFESYCNQEIQSFFNAAALKTDDMIDGFQHKPGIKSSNTCTNNSISSTICIVSKPSKQWNLKNRHQSSSTEMTARMLRSQKLVLEGNLPAGRTLIFKTESEEELEVSDDDGHIQTPPPPKIVIKTPADLKHIASMAIREYPDPSKPMKNHTRVQVVEGHPHQASFYKPIKRGGLYIRRPLNRPSNFNEVLRDTTHLEFFKRYLKAHRSDRPFLFWIAVEGVKNIENVKERQQKARSIIKRYFHSSKSTADKLLQCDADIIREIPLLNIVTTSMLFTAQNIIAKMLEDRWFRKYADTFTDPVFLSSTDEIHSVGVKSTNMRQQHLRRVWLVFTDFIKRAAMFMRCMRNKKFIDLFNKFLDREIHSKEDLFQPVDDSMQSDVVAEHSLAAVPMVDPSQNMDNENERQPHKQRIVNGRLVIFDFLPTDLRFWREILSSDQIGSVHQVRWTRAGVVNALPRRISMVAPLRVMQRVHTIASLTL
ncbi:unnamed protein product [Clavelina lepadiformis]|uniref:RGS domain-containing protein n=1 Tax=Clavelina lepadiformis TaxID=159417 RepID=A0ABP0G0J1_CLALP